MNNVAYTPREGRQFFERFGTIVLVAMAASIPLLYHGVHGLLSNSSNDPRQWMPVGLTETREYDWFLTHFGRDEIAVVSWQGCTLDDPRIGRLANALVEESQSAYFERALSGPQLLRELTSPSAGLSETEARRRLQGNVIGRDGSTTCLVLVVSPKGEADRTAAVQHIYDVAQRTCDLSRDQLRLGGPTVDAAALDVESQRLLYHLAALCTVIVFLAAWQQMKRLRVALMVLGGALFNTALTLSFVYWTGGNMNLTMTNLVPLVFVLSVSMSIHLVNYYLGALSDGRRGAAERALARGWLPCGLAAVTTAVGFCSLSVSSIAPIRDFGIYSAAGMLISASVLLVYLPSALCWSPAFGFPRARDRHAESIRPRGESPLNSTARAVERLRPWIATGFVALMVLLAVGLSRLQATVKLQHRFPQNSNVVRDCDWLEQNIAPLVPLEVVLRFDEPDSRRLFEKMAIVEEVQRELERLEHVEATMSAVTLAPPLPERASVADAFRARVQERKMSKNEDRFVKARYLAFTEGDELWRITVRMNALTDVDYGIYIDRLRSQIDPLIASNWGRDVSAIYTGAIPLIYKAQRMLLSDLGRSFFGAFVVIALVMVVALGNLKAALLAMIPNVFPASSVFGCMGWAGFLVEIGTVSTASIALGIAVDDTFHFLTWFRRGLKDGQSRFDAICYAYENCARAMIQTTVFCALGLLAFTLSSFLPTVRFAWLMIVLLCAALVGDLVLLPALLLGRLGRCFQQTE